MNNNSKKIRKVFKNLKFITLKIPGCVRCTQIFIVKSHPRSSWQKNKKQNSVRVHGADLLFFFRELLERRNMMKICTHMSIFDVIRFQIFMIFLELLFIGVLFMSWSKPG